jgi:hypothetical protein
MGCLLITVTCLYGPITMSFTNAWAELQSSLPN